MEYHIKAYDYGPPRARLLRYAPPCKICWGHPSAVSSPGEPMPKQNYHQARKQRELARKTRQQAKRDRRSARPESPGANAAETPEQDPTARDPASGDGA